MRYLLSKLYQLAVSLRWLLYRWGLLRRHALNHPVISVGNLTVGGTGKTPIVAYLARVVKELGYQPIILSRGYKRKSGDPVVVVSDGGEIRCTPEEAGDEPYLLAQKLSGVPVVVGKDRYRAGRRVEDQYENVLHLLDDGYQHLRLKRNLNILLLDATDPFGGGQLLPAGRLRESLKAIERADQIFITRSHFPFDLEEIEIKIRRYNKVVPISFFYHDATAVFDLYSGETFRLRDFLGKGVVALAAIGNPDVFLADLAHYQLRLLDQFLFRDHHAYTQAELDRVLERAAELQADAVITTEKDAVRLRRLQFDRHQIFALQIEARPEDIEEYKKYLKDELDYLPDPH